MHLASSQKYSHQPHAINLSDSDTLQRHLDVRFHQLNTAVTLEMWQEAFRSAEDIHALVNMSKRAPKPSMMAAYYEKLVRIFAVGSDFLFHAAAYSKLNSVLLSAGISAPVATAKDDTEASSDTLVLLSALAVPLGPSRTTEDTALERQKNQRLATLLSLTGPPSRSALLADAVRGHASDSLELPSQSSLVLK